jgi:hypothetical protein
MIQPFQQETNKPPWLHVSPDDPESIKRFLRGIYQELSSSELGAARADCTLSETRIKERVDAALRWRQILLETLERGDVSQAVIDAGKLLSYRKDLEVVPRESMVEPFDLEAVTVACLKPPNSVNNFGQPLPKFPSLLTPEIPNFKPGQSIAWYATHPINTGDTLLGSRYLCRGAGMFIVAPSGMGKSTLSVQLAILWCCGLVAFGIKPSKALRILIVQSEDDEGDCTEMAQIVNHLRLTDAQQLLVEENTELIRCNDLVGHRFIEALKARLTLARDSGKPFDLVVINPYGVFLGADAKDTDACTQFLNEWLNPLLSEFAIGAILIHHTPKTNFRDTTNWKPSDWMYSGAGAAAMTNWARAYLVIDPCDTPGVYKFIAAKRGRRIGWGLHLPAYEQFWAHSREDGQLLWLPADKDQIALAKKNAAIKADDILKLIPALDPVEQTLIHQAAKDKFNAGSNKVRILINQLVAEGKAYPWSMPRAKPLRSAVGYAQRAQPDDLPDNLHGQEP